MSDDQDWSPATSAGQLIQQGQTIQQMKAGEFATAVSVQVPRDLKRVRKECCEEAALLGESAFYSWDVKNKDGKKELLVGKSVDLIMVAVRKWGNCALIPQPVVETPTAHIFTSYFIDLQTGFTLGRQFRMDKKFPIYGKHDEFRKNDIRFQIGQSKSHRNCGNNALPEWLTDAMLLAAQNSVRTALEETIEKTPGGIKTIIDKFIARFNKQGVTLDMIENREEVKRDDWTVDILVRLSGDIRALEAKKETPETLFPKEDIDKETGEIKGEKDLSAGNPDDHQDHGSQSGGQKGLF